MNQVILSIVLFFSAAAFHFVAAQPIGSAKPIAIVGDASSVSEGKIVVASKTGLVDVTVNDKTGYKRVSAETLSLAQASAGAFSDISVGDKLTISVLMGADGKPLPARTVYFITKASIDEKNKKEAGEWQRRGVMGKVTVVNAQANQMTLETRGMTGATTSVVVTAKDGAVFKRYAPDSIRFDEAVVSNIGETKVGDLVRALGDKSSDGLSFSAEQVIAGAFQTVAGTVKTIDAAKNEVVLKNLQTGKDVTVAITESSVLKRFPAEQAEMLARMQMTGMGGGGGARPMGQPGNGGAAPAGGGTPGANPGQGRPGGMMGGRGGAGGVDEILERSPSITVSDLKAGDIIAFSSTRTATPDRFKAIKLFAGVEPFLRSAQAGGGRRGGQGGVEGGFSIPGLDGMGTP